MDIWRRFKITLKIDGEFGASIPRTRQEILAMLKARMPGTPPPNHTPIEELAEEIAEEVGLGEGTEEERYLPGWHTFKRDTDGLYYEGRCVRGHLKDCALQVANFFPDVANFRAKFVNRVYVATRKIYLGKQEPDGTEVRYIQVMTRKGPRSAIKYIDYVLDPELEFTLLLLDDKDRKTKKPVITPEHIETVLLYGSEHGIGEERSQEWGRYDFVMKEISRS